jgi:DNA-binding MarR family transcriptional regulator
VIARGAQDLAAVLGDTGIGLEGRVSADDHQSLRLWLRLLSCSTEIENEIRRRLRSEWGMTLARFDYLAQLHRHPEGLSMGALSRYLMVTGGNVTGLTTELERDGLVSRQTSAADRRSSRLCLTPRGREAFERVASVHEQWIVDLFSGLGAAERTALSDLLGRLRVQLASRLNPATGDDTP